MTILVTGGAGYIGSHVAQGVLDKGERVVVLDNFSTGLQQAIPQGAAIVAGDVGDQDLLSGIIADHRVSTIMHFAASTVVPDSVKQPVRYYRNNTMNSLSLLDVAIRCEVRHFVFSSTAAVYGIPSSSELIKEHSPTCPLSPYGMSKLMAENILRDAAAASQMTFVILRYFNVAGADPLLRRGQSTPAATHLIKVAAQSALGMRSGMEIYGTDYPTPDGTCIRDYIHVCDLVSAHIKAIDYLRDGGPNLTVNCGYGRGYSVREIIEVVKRVAQSDFAVSVAPRRPGDAPAVVADSGLMRRALSWRPSYDDLETIVTHALAWERQLASSTPLE